MQVHGERASVWLRARLAKEAFCNTSIEHLLILLSDVHSLLGQKQGAADAAGGGAAWQPPSDFSRSTTKYWVRPEDVNTITIIIARQLPILIMHRPPPATLKMKASDLLLATAGHSHNKVSIDGTITSLYLDSQEFVQYHERMARNEGAQLFRLRWYGLDADQIGTVFVERKTHHESWSGESSTKVI